MKIGGFKTPDELEAYGEENFFRDFPQAKKLAMGGTPEAFNMSMPADKFFSYGVPVPPTYYAEGGSLTNRMVYPQIQSADQFFSPVYSNSNNAYAEGGNIEAFPQAISYPQQGWGRTNYFMLQDGGAFPPGMPQYTGMLPVMQMGTGLSGVMNKTAENSNHYGMNAFQDGGSATSQPEQSFYTNKMNQWMDKIRSAAYKGLTKSLMEGGNQMMTPQDEEMVEPGARYGGYPLQKAQVGQAGLGPRIGNLPQAPVQTGPTPNLGEAEAAMNRAAEIYRQANTDDPQREERIRKDRQAQDLRQAAQNMGWGNDVQGYIDSGHGFGPGKSIFKEEEKPKKATKTQAGVSKSVQPAVTQNNTQTGTQTTAAPVAASPAGANQPAANTNTPAAATTTTVNPTPTNTTPTNTTPTTPTSTAVVPPGWRKTNINGVDGYLSPDNQFYTAFTGQSTNTGSTPNQQWNYDPMWLMPGRYRNPRITQGAGTFLEALAAGQIARGEVKLVGPAETRRAILPGNRIKSMTFSVPGTGSPMPNQNYYYDTPKEKNKEGWLRNMFKGKHDSDKLQNDFLGMPVSPRPATQFPVNPPSLVTPSNVVTPGKGPITFDRTNKDHTGAMMKGMLDAITPEQRYGGPYALPMYVIGGPGMENMSQGNPDDMTPWIPDYLKKKIDNSPLLGPTNFTGQITQFDSNDYDAQDEIMNPDGYQKEDTPFTQKQASEIVDEPKMGPDKTFTVKKRRQKFGELGPDAIMAMMSAGTNLMNKMPWNQDDQDFNSALSAYGMPRKPTNRGSYLTNDPGMGNTFRPDQYNPNMRGFYAPDYGYAQAGGQLGYVDGEQYYLTQDQINKVIKAGGRVPGF